MFLAIRLTSINTSTHPANTEMFHAAHTQKLLSSAITEAYAIQSKMESLDASAVKTRLGVDYSIPGDAIAMPFHNLDGSPMLDDDGVPYVQYRVFDVRKDVLKPMRFAIRPGAGRRPYLPSGLKELLDVSDMLVITEGPMKAASAVSNGLACIGIPGVTMWAAPGVSGEMSEDTPVHPEILDAARKVKVGVVVLADSDATNNNKVRDQMQLLAKAITKQSGVVACYAACKGAKDLKTKAIEKVGLDDWIKVTKGTKDAEDFLAYKLKKAKKRMEGGASGGYVALGYGRGGVYYVWSNARSQVDELSAMDMGRQPVLSSLCTHEFIVREYTKINAKGNECGLDIPRLGGEIMAACVARGLFNPDLTRGAGVWLDGGHLVINSDTVFSPTNPDIGRVTEKHVYVRTRDIGIEDGTLPATDKEVGEIVDVLKTFKFARKTDHLALLGMLMLAFVPGALKWRPHAFLHGGPGSAKSSLLGLLKNTLGHAAELSEAQSEAGIRQRLQTDAIAVLCDESEAGGAHINGLLEFLRLSSGGSKKNMGTQDQKGIQYVIRTIGIIAAANPPQMVDTDDSRFLKIAMNEMDKSQSEPALLQDPERAGELGKKLCARLLSKWDLFQSTFEQVYALLQGTPRMAKVVTPVIAAAYVATHSTPCADVQAYIDSFDLSDDVERISAASRSLAFEDYLFGVEIELDVEGRRHRTTVGAACTSAIIGDSFMNRALGVYGMRVHRDDKECRLRINYASPQLRKLFKDSTWANGDLQIAIKKIPGADQKGLGQRDRFAGGKPQPFLSIPLDDLIPETASDSIAAIYDRS